MQIVIIGNGAAGNAACAAIRGTNAEAKITLISDESFPFYSPCVFPMYLSGEVERQRLFLREVDDAMRVTRILGKKVLKIDVKNQKVLLEDEELKYDSLIIASGSKPIIPKIEGIDKLGVFCLKTIEDVDRILAYGGKRVAVIGSGPIGVEAAIALRKRGLQVSIIELMDRILPRLFDKKPSNIIEGIIRENGIKIFTDEKVVQILGSERVRGIETDTREIKCDVAIVAVGMRPRAELAKSAKIKIGGLGGILTDERMRTSVENVYSCGDCVESYDIILGKNTLNLIWPNAVLQGEIAGLNCLGVNKRYRGFTNVVCIDIFGARAVSLGHPVVLVDEKDGLEEIERAYGKIYYKIILKDGNIMGVQSIGEIKDIGVMFNAMGKRIKLQEIKKILGKREFVYTSPWLAKLKRYV